MLSRALKESAIEEERQRRNSQKGKGMKERRLYKKESYKDNFRENQEHCIQVFRKVDMEWVLKKETDGMLFTAQEQALRTNSIKAKVDKQPVSPKCRLCGTKEETVMHL